jgi:hypothetical protein
LPPRGQRFVSVDGQPPVGCCIRCWYGVCTITSDAEARCARDAAQFLRPSPAAALCNLFGDIIGWLRGQSEGYVCHVDPRHGQDHRCGGETLYTSNECSSEVEQSKCRAPHPLLQLVGCMGIRCVVYGSEPPSHPRGKPSSMLGQRYSTLWRCLTARLLHAVFCYLAGVSQFRGQVSEKGVLEHWGLCLIPRACGCALSARRVVDLECSACRTEHAGIPLC